MSRYILVLFIAILFCMSDYAYAWGGGRSRGGGGGGGSRVGGGSGKSSSWSRSGSSGSSSSSGSSRIWNSSRYTTGYRSSSVNVHQKHAREAATQGERFSSRSEAMDAFKKSSTFQSLPYEFKTEPSQRPSYIPETVIRDSATLPVLFHQNVYGYWYKGSFSPLTRNDYVISDILLYHHRYYYGPSPASSDDETAAGIVCVIGFLVLLFLCIIVVYFLAEKSWERKYYASDRNLPEIRGEEEPVPTPVKETTNRFLKSLYSLRKGKVVTLSDPFTMLEYNRAVDFVVKDIVMYTQPTFKMHHTVLRNDTDGEEPLELHLFTKDVGGDFSLFLGILDHEGTDQALRTGDWYHLDETGDKFAEEFHSIFPSKDKKTEVSITFGQYDFGSFYDVHSTRRSEPVGICEYYPRNPPYKFEWQHAVVCWEGEWISCYYCVEVYEGNVGIY